MGNCQLVPPPIRVGVMVRVGVRVRGGRTNGQCVELMGVRTNERWDQYHAPTKYVPLIMFLNIDRAGQIRRARHSLHNNNYLAK